VRRLFTGYTALVARNLPFTALQFPAFEHLRSKLWERRRREHGRPASDEASLLETGLIGGVSAGTAGALAAFITTPSDVVKTRMMLFADETQDWAKSKTDETVKKDVETMRTQQKKPPGAWAVTKQVYAERGVRGLFRGGLFRSAWTALGSGLYLGTYDTAKVWFKRRKPEPENVGL
jgi:solute carrier family 25 (mitochondrial S-adenosylmethionine transporter), member 26